MAVKKKLRCDFRRPNKSGKGKGSRCQNIALLEGQGRCHIHSMEEGKKLNLYINGLLVEEQHLLDKIPIGDLRYEIKLAKLMLRRTMQEMVDYNNSPDDFSRMTIDKIKIKDAWIKDGKLIDLQGLPLAIADGDVSLNNKNIKKSVIADTELTLIKPDFMGEIERYTKIIAQLERVHHDLLGGNSDDPSMTAQLIADMLREIEDNAKGEDEAIN